MPSPRASPLIAIETLITRIWNRQYALTHLHSLFQSPTLPTLQPTMLYFVGLGLADETDITVKGLEVVRNAARVYLEAYTSILLVEHEKLVGLAH